MNCSYLVLTRSGLVRISKQNIKESKHKRTRTKNVPKGAGVKSEILLNVAFDRLNRCKSRIYSMTSEVSDIVSEALQCGVDVYNQAHLLHKAGQYSKAAKYAADVTHFCNLLNNVADENTENILKLPLPPQMTLEKSEKTFSAEKLHPSLKLLDSFIRKKLTRSSKFYKSRMDGYHKAIVDISKTISKTENYH